MKNFGNKKEFGITYISDLEKYADDEDVIQNPNEYLLGGSICFWVKGKNLFAYRDWGPEATYEFDTLRFIVNFLANNLIFHLSEVPFPLKTKATNAIDMIEETAVAKNDIDDELYALMAIDYNTLDIGLRRKRDEWIYPRSLASNDGGTFLPNLMIRRIDDRIELSWHNCYSHSNGEYEFYMLHEKGVDYIDANFYKDVISQFCLAYSDHIQKKYPDSANLYRKGLQKAIDIKSAPHLNEEVTMCDSIVLVELDENMDESRWIKKGNMIIECFDYMGQLWPLYIGRKYLVELELEQLDFSMPELIAKTEGKIEQVNRTFAHYLYGYVENNIFIVGDFKFNFERFNDFDQYEGMYLKFLADRVNVTFFKKFPD